MRTATRTSRMIVIGAGALALGLGSGVAHGESIVAVGTGQAVVTPKDPRSNASIAAAVAEARELATPRGLIDARVQAGYIAAAAGLTLGPITEVSQEANQQFYFFYSPLTQQLGPNRYCGPATKRIVRRVNGKRIVTKSIRKQCAVPPFVTTTLTVTFDAVRTS